MAMAVAKYQQQQKYNRFFHNKLLFCVTNVPKSLPIDIYACNACFRQFLLIFVNQTLTAILWFWGTAGAEDTLCTNWLVLSIFALMLYFQNILNTVANKIMHYIFSTMHLVYWSSGMVLYGFAWSWVAVILCNNPPPKKNKKKIYPISSLLCWHDPHRRPIYASASPNLCRSLFWCDFKYKKFFTFTRLKHCHRQFHIVFFVSFGFFVFFCDFVFFCVFFVFFVTNTQNIDLAKMWRHLNLL